MSKAIYFDMDGTIADLYAHSQWLELLRAFDPTPYETAKVLVNMSRLARYIHKAQSMGYVVGIVSWLSKTSTPEYDMAVIHAKLEWLAQHLPSVQWDELHFVPYGTPKSEVVKTTGGILFDDEKSNREEWGCMAFEPSEIFNILQDLM